MEIAASRGSDRFRTAPNRLMSALGVVNGRLLQRFCSPNASGWKLRETTS